MPASSSGAARGRKREAEEELLDELPEGSRARVTPGPDSDRSHRLQQDLAVPHAGGATSWHQGEVRAYNMLGGALGQAQPPHRTPSLFSTLLCRHLLCRYFVSAATLW